MNNNEFIPSVNYHLWEPCNMRCKFCFATFQDVKRSILPKGHLQRKKALQVVQKLADFGFQKITFAGGEPTLCPWLPELIACAKNAGLTTMIVSNGSGLSSKFLEANKHYLDWVAISIDSLNPLTNLVAGRAITANKPFQEKEYRTLVDNVKQAGYRLKINTVVNRSNFKERMNDFIRGVKPERWKIFQVLPINGQNDQTIDDFIISDSEFRTFINNHNDLNDIIIVVPETNAQIKGSYVMVDPAGRFFDNSNGEHNYSKPILEVGVFNAIQEVDYDLSKFISRGGFYKW
ncbi:MAG: viperin family antiviral radical SAM protein [Bacteroidota bacterium]